jgi:hypothetical protein
LAHYSFLIHPVTKNNTFNMTVDYGSVYIKGRRGAAQAPPDGVIGRIVKFIVTLKLISYGI